MQALRVTFDPRCRISAEHSQLHFQGGAEDGALAGLTPEQQAASARFWHTPLQSCTGEASSFTPFLVHGDTLQNSLVAVVVPDAEVLAARNMSAGSPETKRALEEAVRAEAKTAALRGFEVPKAIHVCANELNALPPRDGLTSLLTPTFKLARNKAREYFKPEIDAMYADINSQAKL